LPVPRSLRTGITIITTTITAPPNRGSLVGFGAAWGSLWDWRICSRCVPLSHVTLFDPV